MNSILAVKTNFGGDIRRFSVSSRTPFKLIEESIGRFYNLDLGSFKICFLDSEGTPQTLTEECYHSLYTEYVEDSTKSILRLNIQAVVPVEQTKPEEPVTVVELPTNVLPPTENTSKTVQTESNENTSTSDVDLVALFENPQFEEKLMYLMTEAMASKTLMDFVKEGFVPSMISQMREIAIREKNRQVDEVKEIPQVQQTPPEEEKEVAPADSIEKTAEQQISEEVNQFVVVNDNTEETQPEAVENQNQETSDQQVVESPAQQVVESPETVEKLSSLIPNVPPEISSSPIKSFIYSLFKPIPKEPENLEEILEKLTAMGFTDREANIEAIKFHNKFNEGIDAIVEDLLLQSALNESKKSSQN